jgi:hypothetical protein
VNTALRRALTWSWYGIFPAMLLIVGAFLVERGCFDRYTLLPALGTRPGLAYVVAGIYTLAHAWIVTAYAATIAECGAVVPSLRRMREVWQGEWFKVVAMAAVLALEYVPAGVWVRLAGSLGTCPQ